MSTYKILQYPDTRIATLDISEIGKRKHHVSGLLEIDVTEGRKKVKEYNKGKKDKISFTSWMLVVISRTLKKHEAACGFLKGKNKLIIFNDINISLLVEKELEGQKVPMPLLIEEVQEKKMELITFLISQARNEKISSQDVVLNRQSGQLERLYYSLPGYVRRYVWKYLLRHPRLAFRKMGNVAVTSLGMMGQIRGWFLPISVHPVCFGLGSIVKKPVVVDDEIVIREMLHMSVLLDHDVIDGANMVRMINDLVRDIESGRYL